jgi:hypothetical protein
MIKAIEDSSAAVARVGGAVRIGRMLDSTVASHFYS